MLILLEHANLVILSARPALDQQHLNASPALTMLISIKQTVLSVTLVVLLVKEALTLIVKHATMEIIS